MALREWPVLTSDDAEDVLTVLREIIRTRASDISEFESLTLQAGNSLWKKLQWTRF